MSSFVICISGIADVVMFTARLQFRRGTMDMTATKTLSIHISALLPPSSAELDVLHNIQVASVLGIGLVYQSSAHRHISEVLLSEIGSDILMRSWDVVDFIKMLHRPGRPPGPEMENSVDRESYSLAAGLALGNVMLAVQYSGVNIFIFFQAFYKSILLLSERNRTVGRVRKRNARLSLLLHEREKEETYGLLTLQQVPMLSLKLR